MEPIIKNEIRLDLVLDLIKKNWRRMLLCMFITSVVTAVLVLCVPRYYVSNVMLAPEYGELPAGGSSLSSAASMFGININSVGTDAIVPEFYPDIVASTDFLVPMLKVEVSSIDGEYKGPYDKYLLTRETYPWWTVLISKMKKLLSFSEQETYDASEDYEVNPFMLTRPEYDMLRNISSSIGCGVDEKSGVITLSFRAQDPLVAATMTNAVKESIQCFMTKYRTEKAKNELLYATGLCNTAYEKYVNAQTDYAEFVDKHKGLSKHVHKIEEERLESEMQLAFNVYNTLYQQKLLNEAEVLKRTPAFTVLQNHTVPVKHAGPKRMLITAFMFLLSGVLYLIWLIFKNGYTTKGNPTDKTER